MYPPMVLMDPTADAAAFIKKLMTGKPVLGQLLRRISKA